MTNVLLTKSNQAAPPPTSRRDVLRQGGGALLASALLSAPARRVLGANDRVRIGMIGCGGIAKAHFAALEPQRDAEVIATCDVDPERLGAMSTAAAARYGKAPTAYADFRKLLENKDIDAVFVASPDHWHALHLIHACRAGKDVYVEKPLSFSVAEGQAMVKAADRWKRVVQVGTQQRSNQHYQDVIAYVRAGKLGLVTEVQTWNVYNKDGFGAPPDSDPPAGVDYDMWLGPAPKRAFNPKRFHGSWRYFRDYGGGYVTDWNTHHQDIVHQALDVWSPSSVAMSGFTTYTDDNRDLPDTAKAIWEYQAPQGAFVSSYSIRRGNARPIDFIPAHADHGIAFFGRLATLVVTRAGWEVYPEDSKQPVVKSPGENKMEPHVRDFLDSIKSRGKTRSDIASMHLSTAVNHIANISWRVGRKLYWNAKTETLFADPALRSPDRQANALLARPPRKPWSFA